MLKTTSTTRAKISTIQIMGANATMVKMGIKIRGVIRITALEQQGQWAASKLK